MKKILLLIFTSLSIISLSAQNIPIDFEDDGNGASWNWTTFENGTNPALEIIDNPDPTGLNGSAKVAKFTALQTGAAFAGCETLHGAGIGSFNIDASNSIIRILVWKSVISDVGIKLVAPQGWSLGEIKVANTVVDQWEQLTFDFSSHIGVANPEGSYDQLVIFPDFNNRAADNVIYFDAVFGDAAFNTSLEEVKTNDLTIFPSPAYDQITIQSDEQIDEVNIYTLTGKLVESKKATGTEATLNVDQLSAGMYLIEATVNGQTVVDKFIKE